MNDFAAAVGPETMIFPVLNGMRHIDLLTKRFGEHAVIGGVCLVASRDRRSGSHRPARGLSATCLWREKRRDARPD